MLNAQEHTNHLIKEKSPYLLQHAHNPVEWYPWSDEALLKAKKEDKPIFLSIGYSTCHWCHVMEEESFSNPEIAALLNRYFVSIKVDREERPDIDSIYMSALQAMTGQGGWPLNLFISPDKKPFHGGTYFPPEHLKSVLLNIADAWKNKRNEIARSSDELTNALNSATAVSKEKAVISENVLEGAFNALLSQYDGAFGGFGKAPKFPTGHTLSFLLHYYYRTGNKKALEMAESSLKHIAEGGIFDQLGGGFHRYSTDQRWFLPHFEKMLYDQAILVNVYLEAYQITKNKSYAALAQKVFEYALRDMVSPEGGFYSALDADSAPDSKSPLQKTEGAYYLWTSDEIIGSLGKDCGVIFNYRYGIKETGNVEVDPRHEFKNENVLSIAATIKDTAARFKKSENDIERILSLSKEKLFQVRARRVRPHLDDKVLTDWNGLMISSLAKAGKILNEPRYGNAAKKCADFIITGLMTEDGRLLHRYRDGAAEIPAFLDDYAFFINGLLDLYETTFELSYLKKADNLAEKMLYLFEDKEAGGFFLSASDQEVILKNRTKEYYDGAAPSGNSLALLALLRLYRVSLKKDFQRAYTDSLDNISSRLAEFPTAFTQLLIALDIAWTPAKEIVIVSKDRMDPAAGEAAAIIYGYFLPSRIVVLRTIESADNLNQIAPWTREYDSLVAGKTTLYVCENNVCSLPVTDLRELGKILRKK